MKGVIEVGWYLLTLGIGFVAGMILEGKIVTGKWFTFKN